MWISTFFDFLPHTPLIEAKTEAKKCYLYHHIQKLMFWYAYVYIATIDCRPQNQPLNWMSLERLKIEVSIILMKNYHSQKEWFDMNMKVCFKVFLPTDVMILGQDLSQKALCVKFKLFLESAYTKIYVLICICLYYEHWALMCNL